MDALPPILPEFVTKTLDYDFKKRGQMLFIHHNPYRALLLLALLIIFGLETYYRNTHGEKGTVYVGGMWTWVYLGILVAENFRLRRLSQQKTTNGVVQQRITFSQSGVELELYGIRTFIPWSYPSKFDVGGDKILIRMIMGHLHVQKKHFTAEELNIIERLLREKITPLPGVSRRPL